MLKNKLYFLAFLLSLTTTPALAKSVECYGGYDVGNGWTSFEYPTIQLDGYMHNYTVLDQTGPRGRMEITYRSQGFIPQNAGQTTDAAVRIKLTDNDKKVYTVGAGGMGGGGLEGDDRMLGFWMADYGNIALLYCLSR